MLNYVPILSRHPILSRVWNGAERQAFRWGFGNCSAPHPTRLPEERGRVDGRNFFGRFCAAELPDGVWISRILIRFSSPRNSTIFTGRGRFGVSLRRRF